MTRSCLQAVCYLCSLYPTILLSLPDSLAVSSLLLSPLCPGLLQMPLDFLHLIFTIKTLPPQPHYREVMLSVRTSGTETLSLYNWC